MDTQACARVSLNGRHGAGKFLTIDAADWREVERLFGEVWVVRPQNSKKGQPNSYTVITTRKDAIRNADPAYINCGALTLARWLTGASTRNVYVRQLNGDFTDLRRANLATYRVGPDVVVSEGTSDMAQDDAGQGDLFAFHATTAPVCPTCNRALPAR